METVCSDFGDWRRVLVLGGARSGKSAFAEALAQATGLRKVYLATAEAGDGEMAERIARHRADRGGDWLTVEEPRDIVSSLRIVDRPDRVILIDCLTLWLTNVMLGGDDVEAAGAALVAALPGLQARVAMVSNEVGLGLVPDTPLGRRFRDAQGRLNARVARACDAAAFVAAGLPLVLKRP